MENDEPCICDHCFVRDLIDLTPDHSKEIVYCIYCEYTYTPSSKRK